MSSSSSGGKSWLGPTHEIMPWEARGPSRQQREARSARLTHALGLLREALADPSAWRLRATDTAVACSLMASSSRRTWRVCWCGWPRLACGGLSL
jgi:hypothetical protein